MGNAVPAGAKFGVQMAEGRSTTPTATRTHRDIILEGEENPDCECARGGGWHRWMGIRVRVGGTLA